MDSTEQPVCAGDIAVEGDVLGLVNYRNLNFNDGHVKVVSGDLEDITGMIIQGDGAVCYAPDGIVAIEDHVVAAGIEAELTFSQGSDCDGKTVSIAYDTAPSYVID